MDAEQFGHYQLLELIGRGGMGEVYRAHDTVKDRVVALKRLPANLASDTEYRARFRKEAAIAARLTEPHIVPIHDFGEIDGRLYLDMRLISGQDLASVLAQGGALDPARAVSIIAQVASALDSAHDTGLLHRDVKPANIMLTGEEGSDFAYLTDFGIARTVGGNADSVMTATGATVGTLEYMAPERFLGEHVDRRADVYALACTLFEALVGRRPFTGTGPVLMHGHLSLEAPRVSQLRPGLPPALDVVLAQGLTKRPDDRYPTCGALTAAATAALNGQPLPAPGSPFAPPAGLVGAPASGGGWPGAAPPVDPWTGHPHPTTGYPAASGAGHPGPSGGGYPGPSGGGYPGPSGAGYPGTPGGGYPGAAQTPPSPYTGAPGQPSYAAQSAAPYPTQTYTGAQPLAGAPYGGQGGAYAPPPTPSAGRPNRTPLIIGALVVVLALVVGGGVIAWSLASDEEDDPVAQPTTSAPAPAPAPAPTVAPGPTTTPQAGGGGGGATSSQITDAADQQLLSSLAVEGFDPSSCRSADRSDEATGQIFCDTAWTFPLNGVIFQQFGDQVTYQNSLYAVGANLENVGETGCGVGYEFGQQFGYDIGCGWQTLNDGTRRYVVAWGRTSTLSQGFVTGDDPSEVYGWWLAHDPISS